MDDLWIWLTGISGKSVLAGAAGGIVRTITLRQRWYRAVGNAVVGALCALFLTPLVEPTLAPYLEKVVTSDDSVAGFTGFIIGLGGISISGMILDIIERRRSEIRNRNGNSSREDRAD